MVLAGAWFSVATLMAVPPDCAMAQSPAAKSGAAPKVTPEEELQQSIDAAGGDRAALVRNLESYLKKYPQSSARPQIYRALVEADLQLQDNVHASEYADKRHRPIDQER